MDQDKQQEWEESLHPRFFYKNTTFFPFDMAVR